MALYNTIVIVCFVISMASTYHYNIEVSIQLNVTHCQRKNNRLYLCGSLYSMFQQLSGTQYSTDVFIQSGTYTLNRSFILTDLYNIQIRSDASKPAIIICHNNSLNYGIAFLQVRDLIINHLTIVRCGMKHNSTSYLSGKDNFIFTYSAMLIKNSIDIILTRVNISGSTGIGLLMYDTGGSVNITESTFICNHLSSIGTGGGVHIEFSECSRESSSCDSRDNRYNSNSAYIFDQCMFEGNAATYEHGNYDEGNFAGNHFVTLGSGGGISLWFNGQAKNNSFEIISSNFTSNNATVGGGLYINNILNATHNRVRIILCFFIRNVGYKGGGGLVMDNVIHQIGGVSKFNTYDVINCFFEENQALTGTGGGVWGFGNREPGKTNATYHFKIKNSSFINNKALFGSAIHISRGEYFDSIHVGSIFTLIRNFMSNNFNENFSIGTVAMSGVDIQFQGCTHFTNNTSTALKVNGASVEFCSNSETTFQNNIGLRGGAISLIDGAKITVYPNTTLKFLRNIALEHGGAIYVELSTPFNHLLSHVCFVRYHLENVPPVLWETNFIFTKNMARGNENNIFASTLKPCIRAYPNGTEVFKNKPFYNQTNKISTLPVKFNFLNNNDKICSNKSFGVTCSIVPGEIFDLPVIMEDELKGKVSSTMFIATCSGSQSSNNHHSYRISNGTIQISGEQNEVCHLQLQTDTDYPASTIVQVTLLKCPPGLAYNDKKKHCQCITARTHQIPAITGCDNTYLQSFFNKYYWIGYKSDNGTDLLYGLCPYHYCYNEQVLPGQLLPREANKTALDKFVCGDQRRTGLLCGQCIKGYSVMMNSPTSTCHKCKDVHLGILYLVLSYILPVSVLFYVIMSYNIRMTTGVISAYLFFSQISSSRHYFLALKSTRGISHVISSIVQLIYSISNLEFFQCDTFSYCLFSNAGTVDILAFKLLLSFLPILLVIAYFLLRRYCTCNHQCCHNCRISRKSITHGISAFLVLCFAKINVLAFGILKQTELFYINGTSYNRAVFLQGDINHFGPPLYILYAIGSLVTIIIIIIIPTIILVFHPILINVAGYFGWGDSKPVLLINKLLLVHKLKPVLDTFQGDYKDKLHFFAGLHFFLYRLIFFYIVGMASTVNLNRVYLLLMTYFLVILLIHVLTMPF